MADLETLDNLKKRVSEARFEDMGLRPELLEAIYKLFPETPRDQLRPTEIQALAIPELLRENHSHSALCS
ncbi:hypothetical protein DSO57_1037676 [Entomophthora muscae]|uniref:Uncharacterized protein n=1 Tax=Entomophthora muscae TaxID=34485 RepID=A0ACC2TX91_9FUNG|nr:hypothetical protein DSO57_1037676 [Entomophthora muscae]